MSDKLLQVKASTSAIAAFVAHCEENQQQEQCGLFVEVDGAVEFVPTPNVAYDKRNSFLVHPKDFIEESKRGRVIAVGHSHVIGRSDPSSEDMVHSDNCLLPFLIYQPEAKTFGEYRPHQVTVPLEGRAWVLGVSDCYTLARDYYKTQGLVLKDYLRNDLEELKNPKESIFLKYLEENDFVVVRDDPRPNDGVLIQVLSDVPNHCGVLLEGSLILHHLQGRLSCREPYDGYWRRHTHTIVRHKRWL